MSSRAGSVWMISTFGGLSLISIAANTMLIAMTKTTISDLIFLSITVAGFCATVLRDMSNYPAPDSLEGLSRRQLLQHDS